LVTVADQDVRQALIRCDTQQQSSNNKNKQNNAIPPNVLTGDRENSEESICKQFIELTRMSNTKERKLRRGLLI